MNIIQYNSTNKISNWELIKHEIPIFASQEYADYLKETKGYKTIWFVGFEKGEVCFVIPFSVLKKGPFKKGVFITSVVYLNNYSSNNERDILNKLVTIIKTKKLCDWIQQPPNWAVFNDVPDGSVFSPFGSYQILLMNHENEDDIFAKIRTKDRQDIRKAKREGVLIKQGIDFLDDALSMIQKTAETAGIVGLHRDEFMNQTKYLGKDKIFVYVAYYKNIPQSTVIFYSNYYGLYAMYAGSINRPFRGATSYLYWQAMKEAYKRKVKLFDFVGARINPDKESKQYRIQKFKAHFGTELFEGFLWKMPINSFKYKMYALYTKVVSILKGKKTRGDIIDQEIKRSQDEK